MNKTDVVYLQDMKEAIIQIALYTEDVTFEEFSNDQMRQDATIRQLEILGEAANKLSVEFVRNNQELPLRQVISMRNFLIHGYDEVDLQIVWDTIQQNIPELKDFTNEEIVGQLKDIAQVDFLLPDPMHLGHYRPSTLQNHWPLKRSFEIHLRPHSRR